MPEIPTDVKANKLINKITKLYGYKKVSQVGSHAKYKRNGVQPITIPVHNKSLKRGTLQQFHHPIN